jgi:hypothetical protein
MYSRLGRVVSIVGVILTLGAGGLALAPTPAAAAPTAQYACWGGPCAPALPSWGSPPVPGTYADAVTFTGYVNLTNAVGYQNAVNAVTYQNLANAAAYRNMVRVATYRALTNGR